MHSINVELHKHVTLLYTDT